jgi:two-component system NarL family sensor kinase
MGSRWARFGRGAVRAVLGPWPFFPWVVFGAVFLLILLQNVQVSLLGTLSRCRYSCVNLPEQFTPSIIGEYGESAVSPIDVVAVVGNAIAAAGASAIVLAVASRYLRKDQFGSPARAPYLAAMLLAAVAGGLARVYILSPLFLSTPSLSAVGIVPTTIRAFIAITFAQSLAGALTVRYARQTAVATAALETVKSQQQLVVEADERARRGVAEFLHDRVQADLLVVAFELRSSVEGADPSTQKRLEKAIAEIERIRSSEVRSASRRLSPAFGSVGLDTALQELADSWGSVLRVRLTFDQGSRALLMGGGVSRDLLTAIYRVVEQALLNAASHGHASRVDVELSIAADGSLTIAVVDDGRGLPRGEIVRGSGTAIMDAWCAVARGSWRWVPTPRGVRLEAAFSA